METSSEQVSRQNFLCWVNNFAVVHIVKSMMTESRNIMPELRLLKGFMEHEGLVLDLRWITSAENR